MLKYVKDKSTMGGGGEKEGGGEIMTSFLL